MGSYKGKEHAKDYANETIYFNRASSIDKIGHCVCTCVWRDAILQALSEAAAALQRSNTQEASEHCCSLFFWYITISLTVLPYAAGWTHSTLFPGSAPPAIQTRDI